MSDAELKDDKAFAVALQKYTQLASPARLAQTGTWTVLAVERLYARMERDIYEELIAHIRSRQP